MKISSIILLKRPPVEIFMVIQISRYLVSVNHIIQTVCSSPGICINYTARKIDIFKFRRQKQTYIQFDNSLQSDKISHSEFLLLNITRFKGLALNL